MVRALLIGLALSGCSLLFAPDQYGSNSRSDGAFSSDGAASLDGAALLDGAPSFDGSASIDGATSYDGALSFDGSARLDGSNLTDARYSSDGSTLAAIDGHSVGGFDATCSMDVIATRIAPEVVILVDQSASMAQSIEQVGPTKWELLGSAMFSPDNTFGMRSVSFQLGAAFYSSPSDSACPTVQFVAPAAMNLEAIQSAYRAAVPTGVGPTGPAIDFVAERLVDHGVPRAIIATADGGAATCLQDPLEPPDAAAIAAVAAVERAFKAGIQTYFVAIGSNVPEDYAARMASAGLGRDPNESEHPRAWVAQSEVQISAAFSEILSGIESCRFELSRPVRMGEGCQRGSVILAALPNNPLVCGSDWQFTDSTHIELIGSRCEEFMAAGTGVPLTTSFPCDTLL